MHAPTTRASTRARLHCFLVALSALVSPWVLGCVPSPPRVAHAFVHPSLDAASLAADGIAVYGFRGLDGTPRERRAYDRHLLTALRRSLPSVRTLPPAKLQRWLTQVNKAEQFGAALDMAAGEKFLEPGTINLVDGEDPGDRWKPGDTRAKLLLHGWDALDELRTGVTGFALTSNRRRVLKNLSVPLCNLMDVTNALCKEMNKEGQTAREGWPQQDRELYIDVGRRFGRDLLQRPVRRVRNRLGAHLDLEAFSDGELKIEVDDFIGAWGDTVLMFHLAALRHPADLYSWLRPRGVISARQLHVVETMHSPPAALRLYVDASGHVVDVEGVVLASDPRRPIQDSIEDAIAIHNAMIEAARSRLPKIWVAATYAIRAVEAAKMALQS